MAVHLSRMLSVYFMAGLAAPCLAQVPAGAEDPGMESCAHSAMTFSTTESHAVSGESTMRTSSSFWSDGSTTIRRSTDDQYDVTLTTTGGVTSALVKDAAGKVLFSGPYTSDAEKAKVSADIAARLNAMPQPRLSVPPASPPAPTELETGGRLTLAGIKQALVVSDAEWAGLQEKVRRVLTLQACLGRNTAALPSLAAGDNPLAAPTEALRAAAKNLATADADLDAKVAALRSARLAAEADLLQAQKALEDGLTPRQRAVLMQLGVL